LQLLKRNPALKEKALLNKEKIKVQSSHPGFCRQVLTYDTEKDKWKEGSCIPFEVPVTTTAISWDGQVVIPSGEIRAGVRTPHILTAKISGGE
jgi:N-acetylneuraminate epimerase